MALTVREAIPTGLAGATACYIGYDLADHGVGVAVIVSTVLAILSTGLSVGLRFQQAANDVQLFTCPEGCGVEIRTTNQPSDSVARLRELATDHSQHPAARS
ncbi:hypothetical protein ACFWP7_31710 [Streptomyces sp. NPDC058470]|uniref:hypothetical protein n=1 Tax=Streptomyces sp. NPDC058470 TaxID=3346515 RepID=UPI003664C2E6